MVDLPGCVPELAAMAAAIGNRTCLHLWPSAVRPLRLGMHHRLTSLGEQIAGRASGLHAGRRLRYVCLVASSYQLTASRRAINWAIRPLAKHGLAVLPKEVVNAADGWLVPDS
jgi:hypothetical protein